MKDKEAIETIKRHADNLSKLLGEPETGMPGWCSAFGAEMTWLTTYWQKGIASANRQESDPYTAQPKPNF